MAKDWQRIALAAIAYKDLLKRDVVSLRRRVENLESIVEAMAEFIEHHWPAHADDR